MSRWHEHEAEVLLTIAREAILDCRDSLVAEHITTYLPDPHDRGLVLHALAWKAGTLALQLEQLTKKEGAN
jgi:hypothetical protein